MDFSRRQIPWLQDVKHDLKGNRIHAYAVVLHKCSTPWKSIHGLDLFGIIKPPREHMWILPETEYYTK